VPTHQRFHPARVVFVFRGFQLLNRKMFNLSSVEPGITTFPNKRPKGQTKDLRPELGSLAGFVRRNVLQNLMVAVFFSFGASL